MFHVPLEMTAQGLLRNIYPERRTNEGHLHYFTKDMVLALLGDAGLRVLDYSYTCPSLELRSAVFRRALMRIPRKLFFWLHNDLAVRVLGGWSFILLAEQE